MAGGVALETLGLDLEPTLRLIASSLLLAGGILTPVQAWLGWARTERALRSRAALPPATLALPLVVLLVTVGLIILAAVVIGPTG
jgi:putative membrane protein